MNVLTTSGRVSVVVRRLKERSLLGRYNNALRNWRRGRPRAEKALAKFKGQTVGGLPLVTDVKRLAELEDASLLDYEEIYSSTMGEV